MDGADIHDEIAGETQGIGPGIGAQAEKRVPSRPPDTGFSRVFPKDQAHNRISNPGGKNPETEREGTLCRRRVKKPVDTSFFYLIYYR